MAQDDLPSKNEPKPKAGAGPTLLEPEDRGVEKATEGELKGPQDAPEARGDQEESGTNHVGLRGEGEAADLRRAPFSAHEHEKAITKRLLKELEDLADISRSKPVSSAKLAAWLKAQNAEAALKPRKNIDQSDDPTSDQGVVIEEAVAQKPNRDARYVAQLVEREKDKDLCAALKKEVLDILSENPEILPYDVVFLYDHEQISRHHASAIYQRLSAIDNNKDVFLILRSPGGEVEPAYLISKMCNRYKLNKFVVGIPADAKSAATLLSLGADELHMGPMSELGPIDPQINDFPALAFSGALERITKLAHEYPNAAEMLSLYLTGSSLDVRALGHYERITESATQYALRLLKSKVTSTDVDNEKVSALAAHFTNHYKDHNFVIDVDEASELFRRIDADVVKEDTLLYRSCHEVHRFIDLFHQVCAVKNLGKRLVIIGDTFILRTI